MSATVARGRGCRRSTEDGGHRLMPGIVAAVHEPLRAVAASGATSVTPLVLHLRPGAREWFTAWLGKHHPRLVGRYERMYAGGSYAPTWYQRMITCQVHELAAEFGIGPGGRGAARRTPVTGAAARAGSRRADPAEPALTARPDRVYDRTTD